jgi:phosphoserine phosphatase
MGPYRRPVGRLGLVALVLLLGCGHAAATVSTGELLAAIRDTPVPEGHEACAVLDADGTLWDFDLSSTLVERTLRERTASDAGLPAFNAALESFALPRAATVYEATDALEHAWSTGVLDAAGRARGWDEDAVRSRLWPHYSWLYAGREPARLAGMVRELMVAQGYRAKVFAGMLAVVARLREAHLAVRVISGGVHEFIAAATADLGFAPDEVRGLKVVHRNGVLTAEVVTPVTCQRGKAALALEMCGGRPMFVFGDSVASGDSAMLALAAYPVAVRPKGRHRTAAIEQGIPILERPQDLE